MRMRCGFVGTVMACCQDRGLCSSLLGCGTNASVSLLFLYRLGCSLWGARWMFGRRRPMLGDLAPRGSRRMDLSTAGIGIDGAPWGGVVREEPGRPTARGRGIGIRVGSATHSDRVLADEPTAGGAVEPMRVVMQPGSIVELLLQNQPSDAYAEDCFLLNKPHVFETLIVNDELCPRRQS
jgi:hypothetical protein